MDISTSKMLLAASGGGAAAAGPLYVDDVFSTFLYEGNGSSRTITNGIDLAGEGGLFWMKKRSGGTVNWFDHWLYDTERNNGVLRSSTTDANFNASPHNPTATSTGFSLTGYGPFNDSGADYASWSFRKAPGFFDVVTWTGTGSGRTIAHNLGSVPGMIIVKRTDTTENWRVYHRSLGKDYYGTLNSDNVFYPESGTGYIVWNNTEPTSSVFSVGSAGTVNANGATYVAYIFAHDDASFGTDEDESIIKCGTVDAGGSGDVAVTLGFEPQWLLVKQTNGSGGDWFIFDNMRGFGAQGGTNKMLRADSAASEGTYGDYFSVTSNGFIADGASLGNQQYIYMAIRRPHKPPTAGTDVFAMDTGSGSLVDGVAFTSGFPVDAALTIERSGTDPRYFMSRLMGNGKHLNTAQNSVEGSGISYGTFDHMTGWYSTGSANQSWMFKRAPGFFDVVTYSGTGSARNQDHGLGVAPELVIVKARTGQYNMNWHVGPFTPGYSNGYLYLNTDMGPGGTQSNYLPSVSSSTFGVTTDNGVNGSGYTYVAYLFATLPGISKVGSYTGTEETISVDCGFTNGARFVLIKRTDSTGNWCVFDSVRGIGVGNDPRILLNSAAAEDTGTNYVHGYSPGFLVTASGGSDVNAIGGSYIFLAIA